MANSHGRIRSGSGVPPPPPSLEPMWFERNCALACPCCSWDGLEPPSRHSSTLRLNFRNAGDDSGPDTGSVRRSLQTGDEAVLRFDAALDHVLRQCSSEPCASQVRIVQNPPLPRLVAPSPKYWRLVIGEGPWASPQRNIPPQTSRGAGEALWLDLFRRLSFICHGSACDCESAVCCNTAFSCCWRCFETLRACPSGWFVLFWVLLLD